MLLFLAEAGDQRNGRRLLSLSQCNLARMDDSKDTTLRATNAWCRGNFTLTNLQYDSYEALWRLPQHIHNWAAAKLRTKSKELYVSLMNQTTKYKIASKFETTWLQVYEIGDIFSKILRWVKLNFQKNQHHHNDQMDCRHCFGRIKSVRKKRQQS